jgi:hypothetical protein
MSRAGAWPQRLARPVPVALAGAAGGAFVALLFTVAPLAAALPVAALVVLLPTLLIEDTRLYWLTLFLVTAQFELAKKLLDGLEILETMQIDYQPFVFVPEIRGSDLPLCALLVLWLNDLRLGKARLYVPAVGVLALGFLAVAALSSVRAPSRYLAAVELARQCKFVLIFLFAANTLDAKRTLRWVWLLVLSMVLLQGSATIFRFAFGFYDPFFGDLLGRPDVSRWTPNTDWIMLEHEGWLSGFRNSFGTTMSPAVTSQLLLLGLPFAALACMRNPLFRRGLVRAAPLCIGLVGLGLTFSRSSVIGGIVALALSFAFGIRARYVPRQTALALTLCTVLGVAAMLPPLTLYFGRKLENVEVRLEQYTTALAMLRDHPLIGIDNSTGEARRYSRYSYSLIDVRNRTFDQPVHSFVLTVLVEVGAIGFLLYFGFFGAIAATAWRLTRPPADPDDACSAGAFLLGILALGVGVLTNPLFDDGVQTFLWLYAGAIVAIARRVTVKSLASAAPLRQALAT